jgi:ribosome modulation factor
MVAGKEQLPVLRINEAESEYSIELAGRRDAMRDKIVKDRFSIRMAPVLNRAGALPEFQMVVDLTVEDDSILPATRPHWLATGWREVKDGQSTMTQGHEVTSDRRLSDS